MPVRSVVMDSCAPGTRNVTAHTGAPVTPDGRYIVVRGRLRRRANPFLDEVTRAALVSALMTARRDVGAALRHGDEDALRAARARVDGAKVALGERGPVWWDDRAPDQNRRMARNATYSDWWLDATGIDREGGRAAR